MRLISWIITLLVLTAALAFTVKNNGDVTLSFWPFDAAMTMPLPLLVFGLLLAGFFMGSLMTWFGSLHCRFEARGLRKEIAALQKKLDVSRTDDSAVPDFAPKSKLPWLGP